MKATLLLERQHRKVEALFKRLEAGRSDPEPLLEELATSLAGHMAIEQQIFYPTVKRIDESLVLESFEEHAIAELALKRLLATSPSDPTFKWKVILLKELVLHHVEEEEEKLLPAVENAIDDDELEQLGRTMKSKFDEVVAAGYEVAIPKGRRTSADVAERRLLGSEGYSVR